MKSSRRQLKMEGSACVLIKRKCKCGCGVEFYVTQGSPHKFSSLKCQNIHSEQWKAVRVKRDGRVWLDGHNRSPRAVRHIKEMWEQTCLIDPPKKKIVQIKRKSFFKDFGDAYDALVA